MNYIKMGKRYINMARVTEIEYVAGGRFNNECYRLFFDYVYDGQPAYSTVDGADMIALEQWLADNSTDVCAPMMVEE